MKKDTNTGSNIHEAIEAEQIEDRQRDRFFNEIIENSSEGVYITDRKGKTLLINKAYERISGLDRKTLLGRTMSELVEEGIISTSVTDEVVSGKKTVMRTQKNNNDKEVFITGNPVLGDDGEVKYVITNVRDITELAMLNDELQAAKEREEMYKREIQNKNFEENIVCCSEKFREVLDMARKISRTDSTVLVLGETGVGKEIVAQYIHDNSSRAGNPYIKINCGAIPDSLLESELFGYAAGAFTGAGSRGKPGLFELADTGTLLLDEIGELPLNLQSALLRVLQDGEVTRIGAVKSKKVDVRIVAATNKDLEKMIEEEKFRSDLFFRLNVVSLNIPPLRERKDDIPLLAEKTIGELNEKYKAHKALTKNFVLHLMDKEWPGNVRELKNYIEKNFAFADNNLISMPFEAARKESSKVDGDPRESEPLENWIGGGSPEYLPKYEEAKEAMERELIAKAVSIGGSSYKAASLLGMSQSTFFRKYQKLFPNGLKTEK